MPVIPGATPGCCSPRRRSTATRRGCGWCTPSRPSTTTRQGNLRGGCSYRPVHPLNASGWNTEYVAGQRVRFEASCTEWVLIADLKPVRWRPTTVPPVPRSDAAHRGAVDRVSSDASSATRSAGGGAHRAHPATPPSTLKRPCPALDAPAGRTPARRCAVMRLGDRAAGSVRRRPARRVGHRVGVLRWWVTARTAVLPAPPGRRRDEQLFTAGDEPDVARRAAASGSVIGAGDQRLRAFARRQRADVRPANAPRPAGRDSRSRRGRRVAQCHHGSACGGHHRRPRRGRAWLIGHRAGTKPMPAHLAYVDVPAGRADAYAARRVLAERREAATARPLAPSVRRSRWTTSPPSSSATCTARRRAARESGGVESGRWASRTAHGVVADI